MISERPAPNAAEEFYKSADQTPPSFTQSVFNSFKEGHEVGSQAVNTLTGKPDEELQGMWDTIQETNRKESDSLTFGQKAFRFVPEMIANGLGMATNPITLPLMVASPLVGKGISVGLPKILPASIGALARTPLSKLIGSTAAKYLPETLGELGTVTSVGFSTFAGLAVPQAIVDNYNRDTRSLNWGGFTEEVGVNGSIGALLSIPGYAAGVLFKNILSRNESIPMPNTPAAMTMPQRLEAAYKEGKLSKEEFEWGNDLYTDPHKPDLNERAANLLNLKGHPVDSAKLKVFFNMLSEDDWKNLNGIFQDELNNADIIEDKTALSDFVLGKNLDKLREDPSKIDGLKGYIAEADYKLNAKPDKLREANEIINVHLHEGMTAKMPFDQKDIHSILKNDPKAQVPYSIPEMVDKLIEHEGEIANLKDDIKRYKKLFKQTGKEKYDEKVRLKESRLEELKASKPELLSPKEELSDIKNKLFNEQGLVKNFRLTKAYERLTDLADVWHNAQSLLDRVNLEADYNKLNAYRNIAKGYVDVLNSNIEKFADTDRVTNYLKQRINRVTGQLGESKAIVRPQMTPEELLKSADKPSANPGELLNQFDEQVNLSDSKEVKDEYQAIKERYMQFKSAGEKLKSMMDCIGRYR